jgi:hypothetical protein
VAVPTVVPPLVQVDGAEPCGPNTVNVIVPLAPPVAPVSAEPIDPAPIAVPVTPVAGADTVLAVTFATVVDVIPAPQPLFDGPLPASPP